MESGSEGLHGCNENIAFGRLLGKEDEILGRIFDSWNFKILDAKSWVNGSIWIKQEQDKHDHTGQDRQEELPHR